MLLSKELTFWACSGSSGGIILIYGVFFTVNTDFGNTATFDVLSLPGEAGFASDQTSPNPVS